MPDGRYCGLAPVSLCRDCLASDGTATRSRIRRSGGPRSGGSWPGRRGCSRRPRHGGSDRRRVSDLAITVRPHVEADRRVRPPPAAARRVRRVAELGAISATKGACSAGPGHRRPGPELPLRFAIVGFSDPALAGGLEGPGVSQTGRYAGRRRGLDLVWRTSADLVLLRRLAGDVFVCPDARAADRPAGGGLRSRAQGDRLRAYSERACPALRPWR